MKGFRGIPPVYPSGRREPPEASNSLGRTDPARGSGRPALDRGARVASPTLMARPKRSHRSRWLRLAALAGGAAALAAAYRFALRYRERVGLPHPGPVEVSPDEFGLAFEDVTIPAGDHDLRGWFVPAESQAPAARRRRASKKADAAAGTAAGTPEADSRRPAIVVVHGWESNRGRTFAHVRYLHAAGFGCLVFDVRGHGDNPPETLPINVPEFAEDTEVAVRWLAARPDVSTVGVLGHSMGAAGAIVAASHEPLIRAVVSMSAPADIVRITRKTFEMAEFNIPDPVATPLAYLTAAVLLAPRRHALADASATAAAASYRGPLFLVHGADDHGVPVAHLELIGRAAMESRTEGDPPVETLVLPGYGHRWLYEDAGCRRRVAAFFADVARQARSRRMPPGIVPPSASSNVRPTRSMASGRCPASCRSMTAARLSTEAPPAPSRTETHMDTWEAIDTTRAIRKFTDQPLEPEHLRRILNAGRRSGSSKNEQNWDFIVCTDRTHLAQLAGVGEHAAHLAGAAAAIALVVPDPATHEAPYSIMWDLGRAAQNMTLAAWELGIGSVPATVYDQPLARAAARLPGRLLVRVHPLIRVPAQPGGADLAEERRAEAARGDRPQRTLVKPQAAGARLQLPSQARWFCAPVVLVRSAMLTFAQAFSLSIRTLGVKPKKAAIKNCAGVGDSASRMFPAWAPDVATCPETDVRITPATAASPDTRTVCRTWARPYPEMSSTDRLTSLPFSWVKRPAPTPIR